MPLLWHVISIYAARGFTRFHPLTGYLGEQIRQFTDSVQWPEGVEVGCVDTGPDTPTGGRILAGAKAAGDSTFCVTYADGVADIDLDALLSFHAHANRIATMTVVRPHLPWGVVTVENDGQVRGFAEKPRMKQWINGGFFVFEPEVLDRLGPDSVLERGPLEGLAADGQLGAYRHDRFWECVDTYKDLIALNDLWDIGRAPWIARSAPAGEIA